MFKRGSYGHIATDDLDNARIMLAHKKYNASVVSSQQCIEKILKEYLQHSGATDATLLKSHKLLKLLRATELPELERFRGDVSEITDCYFDARYPGVDYTEYTEEDAKRFIAVAEEIFTLVSALCVKLPATINPLKFD